MFIFLFS